MGKIDTRKPYSVSEDQVRVILKQIDRILPANSSLRNELNKLQADLNDNNPVYSDLYIAGDESASIVLAKYHLESILSGAESLLDRAYQQSNQR